MQDLTQQPKAKRCFHADVLKLLAIFLVVYNHTDGFAAGMNSALFAPLSAFCKVGVPLFFMVSGALLLGKNDGIVHHIRHRILRFLGVIMLFYAIQASANYFLFDADCSFMDFCQYIIFGNLKMEAQPNAQWFLFAYLGFLIMLPVLRCMASSMTREVAYYFIAAQIIIAAVIPVSTALVWGGMENGVPQVQIYTPMKSDSVYYAFSGMVYIFYTLIGYAVEKQGLFTLKTPLQAILVVSGLAIIPLAEYGLSLHFGTIEGMPCDANHCFMTCLTAPIAIGTYSLVRYLCSRVMLESTSCKTVSYMAGGVIVVFLTENIFRYLYADMIPPNATTTVICSWSLLLALAVMLTALCLGIVLKHIPWIKSIL